MDRGQHRTFLGLLGRVGIVAAALLVGVGIGSGQTPSASPASPSVSVPPAPAPSATPDIAARKRAAEQMTERRQREIAGEQEAKHRIEQLPPDEREAFKRNLALWRELPPAERQTLRSEVDERMRTEIDKAVQECGLHLDKDQREVFALRYRQERRRLERELQEKLNAERVRRLPAIIDGLKHEFAGKSATPVPPPTAATPAPTAKSMPSVSVPAAAPSPH